MEQDYDRKFEEMKKYIPFLESMIKRLESNSSTSGNPRQAQLAKIRSLRDLLLDKKKRMKMENLLKCEQVLVNLYAKVEQRDCFPNLKNDIDTALGTENAELSLVRNKLKNVASNLKDQETLPEIARASKTEEACTAGSKEPALFQRRPNKSSVTPPPSSFNNSKSSPTLGNRNYTRVLMSPDHDTNWQEDIESGKPLYSRRSPRRTPLKSPRRRLSPHRKERKPSTNQPQITNELKDLNITLKVPEESLNSLNTKDILSRIINCSDNDVDIDTLRGLRTQILSELKQTGAKDDISDLILKSYNNKKEFRKKEEEVEEGELSDSESEIIESIYGSLVVVDKDQNNKSITKISDCKDQDSRKIQICLVINSEKEGRNQNDRAKDISVQNPIDESEFESFTKSSEVGLQNCEIKDDCEPDKKNHQVVSKEVEIKSDIAVSANSVSKSSTKCEESKKSVNTELENPESFTPNFYKPVLNVENSKKTSNEELNIDIEQNKCKDKDDSAKHQQVEIPLLDLEASAKQEVVHEIDILQALKNEILSEQISVADPRTVTPPLHQPKVTKVANMHGMISKKRISIEKYKEKTTASSKPSLFTNEIKGNSLKDDLLRKQSIKLTEKEFERFNLSNKLSFDESSEDEVIEKRSPSIDDVYGDLVPKSPDHEDFADTGIKPPVIIPADPIKTTVVCSKTDVDMRLPSVLSSHVRAVNSGSKNGTASITLDKIDVFKNEIESNQNDKQIPLADPRVRRDFVSTNVDSSILVPVERTPRALVNFTSNITPIMMPNIISNMAPNRMSNVAQNSNAIPNMIVNPTSNNGVYEMTPSHQTYENEDYIKQNVYAPTFPVSDPCDTNDMVNDGHSGDTFLRMRNNFENVRNDVIVSNNDFQNTLFNDNYPLVFNRSECPQTPVHPFGMSDCPPTPIHSFGLLETPMTPMQTFGRCDPPMTPVHPFGRAVDCPSTPNHPFGRAVDCPSTPNHPFGRAVDCPSTPNHPFGGRTEIPMTPSHPFGRTDFPQNQVTSQIPPLRYTSFQGHRINRSSDYNNYSKHNDEKDCNEYTEHASSFNSRHYKYDQVQRNFSDNYRHYGRHQNNVRVNKNTYEQHDSHYSEMSRRESSSGRSMTKNYKNARHYSNDRKGYRVRDYRYEKDNVKNFNDGNSSRSNIKRDHNIGRNTQDEKTMEGNEINPTCDNILSIDSHAGRPFIIDTSVNRSFQEKFENLNVPSFDARRRRASSVGRTLIGEKSSCSDLRNTKCNTQSLNLKKNVNFRRASSVGREIAENDLNKNFKDIKEELQSYKHKHDEKLHKSINISSDNGRTPDVRKRINERDPRLSRRDEHDFQPNKNESRTEKIYSQRGYNRDPRLRREFHEYHDVTRSSSREYNKHGIVYSSDNIAKGTILGSGYGVKNYKIPKIKRVSEETGNKGTNDNDKKFNDTVIDDSCGKKIEEKNEKTYSSKQKQDKRDIERRSTRWDKSENTVQKAEEQSEKSEDIKVNELENQEQNMSPVISDNVEKRITRSSRKNNLDETIEVSADSPKRKVNKMKKIVLDDSDTESIEVSNDIIVNKNCSDLKKKDNEVTEGPLSEGNKNQLLEDLHLDHTHFGEKEQVDHKDSRDYKSIGTEIFKSDNNSNSVNVDPPFESPSATDHDNSIGVELEMFSDNVASDPVIENINALIADLDDDIDTSKNDGSKNQFTKEITLENMLDNITCIEKTSSNIASQANEVHNADLTDTNKSSLDSDKSHDVISVNECISLEESKQVFVENVGSEIKHKTENYSNYENSHNNEVSTTEGEKSSILMENAESQQMKDLMESCSTPDSTIDVNENNPNKTTQDGLPDSTNDLNCEMSSDITSTHSSYESKDNVENNLSRAELPHLNDSVSNLLSILKDKSKIKELLIMLNDQSSENDKLKKKLEKLSEIVSDDEDLPPSESNFSDSNTKILNKSKIDDLKETKQVIEQPTIEDSNICQENNHENNTTEPIDEDKDEESVPDVPSGEQDRNFKETEQSKDKEQLNEIEKSIENNNRDTENQDGSFCSSNDMIDTEQLQVNKKSVKSIKATKKGKVFKNRLLDENKRFTRSDSANIGKSPVKKPSRELKRLQDDIKEMFMHDDVFNSTGIRMCRLAKLVEENNTIEKPDKSNTENSPVVILEKVKQSFAEGTSKLMKKKQASKSKATQKETLVTTEKYLDNNSIELKTAMKLRPGPKSKTKVPEKEVDADPYMFESDSFSESNNTNVGESKVQSSSESECESFTSSNSFGSNDLLEFKKKSKRKRRCWQAGVIKPKNKKKKSDMKNSELASTADNLSLPSDYISDEKCYTDISYCFEKNVVAYSCRFCTYKGPSIVHHYRKQHPHCEIPLSRLSPEVAKEAIVQCQEEKLGNAIKIQPGKYICRFCFKEFGKKKTALETFFWHVVSVHTGEYKQLCSECVNETQCPFNLDIPPPPKGPKGLIGYICGKCNFTQVSLENIKSHVINRHNDEETEVYAINLSGTKKKSAEECTKTAVETEPRILRSSRLNQNTVESSDDKSYLDEKNDNDTNKLKPEFQLDSNVNEEHKPKPSKIQITFENDDAAKEMSNPEDSANVKIEQEQEPSEQDVKTVSLDIVRNISSNIAENFENTILDRNSTSDDIFDYPHFRVNVTDSGTKEYVCCINGSENHYRTALLISFKKHVQLKHQEKWDGFCFVCKLIVTTQGNHLFKDCLQHFIDKHIDNFPIMEKSNKQKDNFDESKNSSKSYLNVRPFSELVSQPGAQFVQSTLPIIESVVSLGASTHEPSLMASVVDVKEEKRKEDEYKYEEAQAKVMAGKNNVVLAIMMNREKIVHIFKCAGRFCSYSTDNAEDALRHAVAHERVGGESSLDCAYCDFDSSKNAVDLVTHVFKAHGNCHFVCGRCFYRGAASQLVRAHEMRLHCKEQSLIYRSTVTARSNTAADILSRDVAVPYYVCNQATADSSNGVCEFKTYTSGKFGEHLETRHSTDTVFSCFICSFQVTKSSDLLLHVKGHGFKVYQCTWCVHGADSETEFLAHASEKHPNKQPQAYLRIITNKEGTTGFRVLPLAQLNNSKIPTIDVTPNCAKGNPEREAGRSIDLEKLIGETNQMIESMMTSTQTKMNSNDEEKEECSMPYFDSELINQSQDLKSPLLNQTAEQLKPEDAQALIPLASRRPETPKLGNSSAKGDVHKQQSPVVIVKNEPTTSKSSTSDLVYCLDSDEEAPNKKMVDLTAEETAPAADKSDQSDTPKRLRLECLFKCGLCYNTVLKNIVGFKRHVTAVHQQKINQIACAHCPFIAPRDVVANHYLSDHCLSQETISRYVCGVCDKKYATFGFVKKHLKDDHNMEKLSSRSLHSKDGEYYFVVDDAGRNKLAAKRKLPKQYNLKSAESPVKMKKFGPSDIVNLPINPILDELVYCALCEFSTKVRLNMVRHLQLHAEQQPVPQTAPVNPVPHLETNEKHFDKMVNLASSSIASRIDKTNKAEQQPVQNPLIPPETVSRYPKYVPDRQRYTCGAKECCYISLDEHMFKYHWETLHSESKDYRCMHCPPHQHLDNSKPLSASRIISHLKMHDMRLYACSTCHYYHNRRQVVEKHVAEFHSNARVVVVREESEQTPSAPNSSQPSNAAPTMDLKPWQCGLCKFKSMLRPEVVDHCAKIHQSKMQYKCTYCAFRTSALDNITKHQGKSHADKAPETFYFYYREGSIPDEPDGTPRWQKQRQKNPAAETLVKTEAVESRSLESGNAAEVEPTPITIPVVDLNIVKRDPDSVAPEQPMQDLCATFGQFCEPNGLKFKCPLCETVSEETKEAMQSHLYEELQYRKWGCGLCSYKAFHKNGLFEHMRIEHRRFREPIELPMDYRVETWIAKALDHQFLLIEKNKFNLPLGTRPDSELLTDKSNPVPSTSNQVNLPLTPESGDNFNTEDLESFFGRFGDPEGLHFRCPKCNYKVREEIEMRNHLEIELNKIRWCCSSCSDKFQNYHEAQFHCKSVHTELVARAVEAVRDLGKRDAWISAVLQKQKCSMTQVPMLTNKTASRESTENVATDNSLLVVRYEERVATPEVEMANLKGVALDSDEDDEKLVIDESSQAFEVRQCPFCTFKCNDIRDFKEHITQHSNIKPYFCSYCDLNGYRRTVLKHLTDKHKGQPLLLVTRSQRSMGPPLNTNPVTTVEEDVTKLICLQCETSFTNIDAKDHMHDNVKPSFAKKGQVVVKCTICLLLLQNIEEATAHHQLTHPDDSLSYSYYKLLGKRRTVFFCVYCDHQFRFWKDVKVHWSAMHSTLPLQFRRRQFSAKSDVFVSLLDDEDVALKRESDDTLCEAQPSRKCARKSTAKLPMQAVAKKSTTKLPLNVVPESSLQEYSYYGVKPCVDDLENVRTSMTFCNTHVSFTFKQLSEVIKISPKVVVKEINK